MFLPLHGTFFFSRGVDPGAFFPSGGLVGVTGALFPIFSPPPDSTVPFGVKGRCFAKIAAGELPASPCGSTTSGTLFAISAVSGIDSRPAVPCLRVSVLDRALGCCLEDRRDDVRRPLGLARGVAELLPSNQAASSLECEPLNEECSLSVPSLSQWRGSVFSCAAVC